ncbi:uncharacterized protein I303_105088 [Kwoniella dejecticola CBS 10117]|uniref:Uncharacterized protein n=1 Tax=Kwoniella dejecticola CBS 10117 TaxID=1296121 RepID=A0A1A6A3H8_9TREE|nr:uncharacterized protein I303_05467 [Kwoniella dejecticola CBS 10117]OBR84608.1 hypothetical protein I303_05467 [Kwoniella dejecticola CBS 10117]
MSGCVRGETLIEQVHLYFVENRFNGSYTYRHSWDGCLSALSPLSDIFERWAGEEHCGEAFQNFEFRLRNPTRGLSLTGTVTPRDLDIHSGTRIYVARNVGSDFQK